MYSAQFVIGAIRASHRALARYSLDCAIGYTAHPGPLPWGERTVHRLSITPVPEFGQRPSAQHQADACCSLSLRERVRVRGKYSVEYTKCSISWRLSSKLGACIP